jgi:hypothetical protein
MSAKPVTPAATKTLVGQFWAQSARLAEQHGLKPL